MKGQLSSTRSPTRVIEAEVDAATDDQLTSYLAGALRDGTYSHRHKTLRLSQGDPGWRDVIRQVLDRLGRRNWAYAETGRPMYVVEWCGSSDEALVFEDGLSFARGYFDAEGGIPRRRDARFYIQMTQKDRNDLQVLRSQLVRGGIACGRLHNPSVRVDLDYWRFYVATASHRLFIDRVGSWHPRKRSVFMARSLPGIPPS